VKRAEDAGEQFHVMGSESLVVLETLLLGQNSVGKSTLALALTMRFSNWIFDGAGADATEEDKKALHEKWRQNGVQTKEGEDKQEPFLRTRSKVVGLGLIRSYDPLGDIMHVQNSAMCGWICFALDNEDSLSAEEVTDHVCSGYAPAIPRILVGLKKDVKSIDDKKIQQALQDTGAACYLEVSAFTMEGVKELAEMTLKLILEKKSYLKSVMGIGGVPFEQ